MNLFEDVLISMGRAQRGMLMALGAGVMGGGLLAWCAGWVLGLGLGVDRLRAMDVSPLAALFVGGLLFLGAAFAEAAAERHAEGGGRSGGGC